MLKNSDNNKLVVDDKHIRSTGYLWNALASVATASSSVLLLMIVKRCCGIEAGATFSIAVAATNLLINVGHLNVFGFQISDIKEEYSYKDYFTLRILSVSTMIIISYILIKARGYDKDKGTIIFLYCVYKGLFSFFDLVQARYQQKNRIDLSAKYAFLKIAIPDLVLISLIISGINLQIAIVFSGITLLLLSSCFQRVFVPNLFAMLPGKRLKVSSLFLKCFPVFYYAFINALILNSSKYVIDYYMDDTARFYYAVLMLPTTTIHMTLGFAYRPALTDFANLWMERKHRELQHKIMIIDLLAIGTLLILIVLSKAVIIPLLSFLYHISNLAEYFIPFIVLLVAGCMQALTVLYSYLLTIVRGQKHFVWIYSTMLAITIIIPIVLTKYYLFIGAAVAYLILSIIQTVLLVVTYNFEVRRNCKNE